jgi:hypothetical protein
MTIKLKHVAAMFRRKEFVQQTVIFDSPHNLSVQLNTAKFSQSQKMQNSSTRVLKIKLQL